MSSFLLFSVINNCSGQQYNNWYFGQKAGLSFNNPANQPVSNILTNSVMKADGGCSSICDSAGNLLFYTNGVTVYNRNHEVMWKGDGLAGISTIVGYRYPGFQNCIIIQHPAGNGLYYIFTTNNDIDDPGYGYRYSIVDMKRDNGNGEVTAKNILLSSACTDRLTAARHADGVSVWLITNNRFSNIFNTWLITCNGLQPDPVVSEAGEVLGSYSTDWSPISGIMKVSPDGKQLCQTHSDGGSDGDSDPTRFFQLFDFDNSSGKISNPRKISYDEEHTISCEYSPDSKYLYVTRSKLRRSQPGQYSIDQLEAKPGTEAAIISSRIRITTCGGSACGNDFETLQTGPDGKIYLNRQHSAKLSVISYPNIKGIGCNLEPDKIDLTRSSGPLPNMINDGPVDPYNNFNPVITDSCNGIVQFNGQTVMAGPVQWFWDFGDGTTSSLQNPLHNFIPDNELYTVKLTITSSTSCGYIKRIKEIFPQGTLIKPGFDFVVRCDSGYVRFVNTSGILPDTGVMQYGWNFGDGNTSTQTSPMHSYAAPGVYSANLKIETGTACLDTSIFQNINLLQLLNIQAPPDQSIDAGRPVQLFVTGGGSSFQWTPAQWLSNPDIANPIARPMDTITYMVTATDAAGCKAKDSVTIYVKNTVAGINIPTAFTPNNDAVNDIIRPILGSQYSLKDFSIFNRWGKKVFSTAEADEGWDGKINARLQNTGTYVWVIKVSDAQGKIIIKRGTVTLIR